MSRATRDFETARYPALLLCCSGGVSSGTTTMEIVVAVGSRFTSRYGTEQQDCAPGDTPPPTGGPSRPARIVSVGAIPGLFAASP